MEGKQNSKCVRQGGTAACTAGAPCLQSASLAFLSFPAGMRATFCLQGNANLFKFQSCVRHQKHFSGFSSNSGDRRPFCSSICWGASRTLGPDYISLLREYAVKKSTHGVKRIHLQIKVSGFGHLILGNKLVDAYIKCGSIEDARRVFDEMPKRHIVMWNSLISAYIHSNRSEEALALYRKMLPAGTIPDEFTFSSVLKALSVLGLLHEGRMAHGRLIVLGLDASNVFIGSALVKMYAGFGKLRAARTVLDYIAEKDVVVYTAMVVGCTQNREDVEALEIFGEMVNAGVRANEYTFASVLIASGNLVELRTGKVIHGLIIKCGFQSAVPSQTSLVSMYSKNVFVDDSLKVFNEIANPNIITWTALITGLVQNSQETCALVVFRSMICDSVTPNAFTMSTVLRACSCLVILEEGNQIHAFAVKIGLVTDKFVVAALLDFYGKCGTIEMARNVFDSIEALDIVAVNSMIYGYSQNGYGVEAIRIFDQINYWGLEPNETTYICVLSACTNCGLIEEGRRIFSLLCSSVACVPTKDHYACMVDLLGRAGKLEEAEHMILQMAKPDIVVWRTLLGACKIHGDAEMTKRIEKHLSDLELQDEGTYILMSNIYASTGNWEEAIKVKGRMRQMNLKKEAAVSWVEVNC